MDEQFWKLATYRNRSIWIAPLQLPIVPGAINAAFLTSNSQLKRLTDKIPNIYVIKQANLYKDVAYGLVDILAIGNMSNRLRSPARMTKPTGTNLDSTWKKIVEHVQKGGSVLIMSPVPVITQTVLKKFPALIKLGTIKDAKDINQKMVKVGRS